MPVSFPVAVAPAANDQLYVRKVPGVTYAMPQGLSLVQHTYTYEALCRGKLLLLDEEHPMPEQAPLQKPVSIAAYGKGMVPVRDLSLQTGKETLHALTVLFSDLRQSGYGGFVVWRGFSTAAQLEANLLTYMRQQAAEGPLEIAAVKTLQAFPLPTLSELQQEYTVELRLHRSNASLPDACPLEETIQGRQLLHHAWRNGFVRTRPGSCDQNSFCFRYVGVAHATAMTFLDVDLPTYLAILHEKRVLTVRGENDQTFVIQCVPLQGERVVLALPKGAANEVSSDNTGYAVVASTLSQGWQTNANATAPVH